MGKLGKHGKGHENIAIAMVTSLLPFIPILLKGEERLQPINLYLDADQASRNTAASIRMGDHNSSLSVLGDHAAAMHMGDHIFNVKYLVLLCFHVILGDTSLMFCWVTVVIWL
jgi:hypothetical protein